MFKLIRSMVAAFPVVYGPTVEQLVKKADSDLSPTEYQVKLEVTTPYQPIPDL